MLHVGFASAPFLLSCPWTGDATLAQTAGGDRLHRDLRLGAGGRTWDASRPLETSPRRPKSGSTHLLDLGNDGQWHWIALKDVSTMFGHGYLELATTQIDSLVFLSSCDGVVKDVDCTFLACPTARPQTEWGNFTDGTLPYVSARSGSVRGRQDLPRGAVGQAFVGAFARGESE